MDKRKLALIVIATLIAGCWLAVMAAIFAVSISTKPMPTEAPAFTPGPGVTTLWLDVPPFPGAEADIKNNLLFNGKSSSSVSMQYYTDQKPEDVASYYTNELMKTQGWIPQPYKETKFPSVGHAQGIQRGDSENGDCVIYITSSGERDAFCYFQKDLGGGVKDEMTISASVDKKNKRTSLDYQRSFGAFDKK